MTALALRPGPLLRLALILVALGGTFVAPGHGSARRDDASPHGGADRAPAMFRGDAAHTGLQPGPGPVGEPVPRWRFQTSGAMSAAPTVADGVVYLGGNEGWVYAVDAGTGYARWAYETGNPAGCAPAVLGDWVIVANGGFHTLDAETGEAQLGISPQRYNPTTPPTIHDGLVYLGGQRGTTGGYFGAQDPEIGVMRWRHDTAAAAVAAPAVAAGMVFGGTLGYEFVALDVASGEQRWRFRTDGAITAAPAYADGVVFVRSWDNPAFVGGTTATSRVRGVLYALDAATGTERWRLTTDAAADSSPAVVDGRVYVGGGTRLYAVDARDGSVIWRFTTGGDVVSSPAVTDGVVYVGSRDGNVYAVDAATGEERWRFATGDPVESSPAVADGAVFVAAGTSLWAIEGG